MKTSIENLLSNQLHGLLLLPSQEDTNGIYLLAGCIILCIGLLALLRWKQRQNTAQRIAIKQIKILQDKWNDSPKNQQAVATKLAQRLRQGLDVIRLDEYMTPDSVKWGHFNKKLNTLCYAVSLDHDASDELEKVIQESLDWLSSIEK